MSKNDICLKAYFRLPVTKMSLPETKNVATCKWNFATRKFKCRPVNSQKLKNHRITPNNLANFWKLINYLKWSSKSQSTMYEYNLC